MGSMLDVFRFECRYQSRGPLFLIVAGVFFVMTFLGMASDAVQIGGSDAALNLNSVFAIIQTHLVFTIIGMFPAIAFVATAITRDHELRTAEVLYSTAVRPAVFAGGRFLGGFAFAAAVGIAALFGTLAGTFMPWLDSERIGAFNPAVWFFTAAVIIVPNYFFTCSAFFCVAALTRSMAAAYGAAMVFLAGYFTLGAFTGPEDLSWVVYIDPFGGAAMAEAFRYATVAERNTQLPTGSLLANRLIWTGIGAVLLFIAIRRFRFTLHKPSRRRQPATPATPNREYSRRPSSAIRHSILSQFRSQLRMDIRGVLRSVPFWVILAMGILNVIGVIFGSTTQPYNTDAWPVTGLILTAIEGGFLFFVLIIVVYYAGELVYRERAARVAELLDATPAASGALILAKVVALWAIIAMLLLVVMLTGMVIQVLQGFTHIEPLLYLKGLFLVSGPTFALLAVLAVTIAVFAGNRWTGMLAMIVVFLGLSALESFGYEHNLYLFAAPTAEYSDMNGYGHFIRPLFWFTLYWAFFCVVLLIAAHLLNRRGYVFSFREQLEIARNRLSRPVMAGALLAALAMAATGIWIFHNTNVLNEYLTEDDLEARQANYERNYKSLEKLRSLDAVDVQAQVDIYPEERRLESRGTAKLANLTGKSVAEMVITINPQLEVGELELSDAQLQDSDVIAGHYRFRFNQPVPPEGNGDLRWKLQWNNPGFVNARPNNRIVANGTFVDSTDVLPVLGYNPGRELQDNNKRREHGLGPLQRMPRLGDPEWIGISQFGVSTRAGFDVTMSTSADQIAIAPGYLQEEWTQDDRRYFRYRMDQPIWPFFSFSSARYAKVEDRWNDVNIAVYHDPKHPFNVPTMLHGTRASLDYFTREFSPYQYRQFRILEFPRYATFAQSFPNTIPFSEGIGFISNVEDPDTIDFPFYVTAHEMAHQWWGHQVAGANMQGQTVIVETLAQYSALMVMEKTFGAASMRRFIKFELDSYLASRGGELIEELPLLLTENQPYLHYRKGSVAMYALRQTIGEEAVNRALRSFLRRFAFQPPPFPTSRDLYDCFVAETPDEYKPWVADLFERITLHDLRVVDANLSGEGDSRVLNLTVTAHKRYADGKGNETETPMDEWVDIALLPEETEPLAENVLPEPLHQDRYRLQSGINTLQLPVTGNPVRVVVDPGFRFIDRNPDDNIKGI
jgi:hypothetical protein